MTGLKDVERFTRMRKNSGEDTTRWLSSIFKELLQERLEQLCEALKSKVRADGRESQS